MRRTRNIGLAVLASLAVGTVGGAVARAADVTLTVSRWAGPQADAQKQLLDEYSKETGVAVKLDAIDYGQLKQKQTLNMSTKTGEYDLIYLPEAWFGEYSKAGYLVPLDNYLKDTKLTGEGWDFADFTKAGLAVYTANGSLQALPYFAQTPLLVYDKDALKQAGFDEPKSWEDLLKAAKYFKEHGSGIALPYRQGSAITNVMATLLAGDGANFFNASGKLDLTQPAVVETVKFMQDLGRYGLNGSNGWHWDEVNKALQFGQAPMGITTSGLFTALENADESNVAGKLGYAAIPYNKQAAGLLQTWAWGVPSDSKNKEEAFKLAAWLDSKKALKEISKTDPSFISFRSSLASDPEIAKNAPWLATANKVLANGVTLPLQPAASQLLDALATGLSGVVTNGDDPAQMLKGVETSQSAKF
ncbi:ABC transporter substrate-binding protein [Rhizobium lusitanum]|uniref:ABC transporter substrate-binding protein n=1 Tax=Rhizobium lusitanum TaxID=293958 RepID=UPI0019582216|nr:sugar ABC transporter substrate-binding protein [Rhizobium lusitanum]